MRPGWALASCTDAKGWEETWEESYIDKLIPTVHNLSNLRQISVGMFPEKGLQSWNAFCC